MTIRETITWHCDRDSCPTEQPAQLGEFPKGWVCMTVEETRDVRELTFCSEQHALDFLMLRRQERRRREKYARDAAARRRRQRKGTG